MSDLLIYTDLSGKIIPFRGEAVMVDADVAVLYGVQTREITQAVKNNPDKFPEGYVLTPDNQELANLRSKILTSSCSKANHGGTRYTPKLFTEKGLYMLATILKGKRAVQATISIVETYAKVRTLRQNLLQLHDEKDPAKQKSMMGKFGEILSDVVMPDLRTDETESSLELNFIIGKIKHTVTRKRVKNE